MTAAEHHSTMPRSVSRRSLGALDALNFALADVRDGIGPFLAVYLKTQNWHPASIGIAVASSALAAVLLQAPAGALVDVARNKRLIIALASGTVIGACLIFVSQPSFTCVIIGQIMCGAANVLFSPAVAAISLGLVGQQLLHRRLARNEAFNHGGNLVSAAMAAVISKRFGTGAIFLLSCAFAIVMIISALTVKAEDIDYELARGGELHAPDGKAQVVPIYKLLSDWRVAAFSVCVFLFHFGNAAMLTEVGQELADLQLSGSSMNAGVCMAACIIVAQLCMIPTALLAGKYAHELGRKPVFLVASVCLPLRGLIFAFSHNAAILIATQILDGVSAGIYGVVAVLIVFDLTKNTGRFNLTLGLISTGAGLGAAASNAITGWVVGTYGYAVGFHLLSFVSLVAALIFWRFMPETNRIISRSV
ncbi:MAG TPA: MFS transporter [Trichormus sp.]